MIVVGHPVVVVTELVCPRDSLLLVQNRPTHRLVSGTPLWRRFDNLKEFGVTYKLQLGEPVIVIKSTWLGRPLIR